jgi:hypothetical protein
LFDRLSADRPQLVIVHHTHVPLSADEFHAVDLEHLTDPALIGAVIRPEGHR